MHDGAQRGAIRVRSVATDPSSPRKYMTKDHTSLGQPRDTASPHHATGFPLLCPHPHPLPSDQLKHVRRSSSLPHHCGHSPVAVGDGTCRVVDPTRPGKPATQRAGQATACQRRLAVSHPTGCTTRVAPARPADEPAARDFSHGACCTRHHLTTTPMLPPAASHTRSMERRRTSMRGHRARSASRPSTRSRSKACSGSPVNCTSAPSPPRPSSSSSSSLSPPPPFSPPRAPPPARPPGNVSLPHNSYSISDSHQASHAILLRSHKLSMDEVGHAASRHPTIIAVHRRRRRRRRRTDSRRHAPPRRP